MKVPESLITRYEVIFNTKLTKTQSVVELDGGTLQLVGSQGAKSKNLTTHQQPKPPEKLTEDEVIMKYAKIC